MVLRWKGDVEEMWQQQTNSAARRRALAKLATGFTVVGDNLGLVGKMYALALLHISLQLVHLTSFTHSDSESSTHGRPKEEGWLCQGQPLESFYSKHSYHPHIILNSSWIHPGFIPTSSFFDLEVEMVILQQMTQLYAVKNRVASAHRR